MTVSIGRIDIEYYLSSTASGEAQLKGRKDLTAYYTESGAPAGKWIGSGLSALGFEKESMVNKSHARKVYENLENPFTGKSLGKSPVAERRHSGEAKTPTGNTAREVSKPVAGFDLTFSVPKSVSALWAVAPPALQGQLYAAHEKAVRETLEWAEREVIQTRSGRGGVVPTATRGMVASVFDHWDSRAGDPQLHTHAVILNRVQRASDGAWLTLDSYTLHRNVVAISEKFNSILFDRIYESVGAVAEIKDGLSDLDETSVQNMMEVMEAESEASAETLKAELVGVPDELIREFSTRSLEINAMAQELVAAWEEKHGKTAPAEVVLQMRQKATLETRTPKDQKEAHRSLAEKMITWRDRTVALGLDPASIVRDSTGLETAVYTSEQISDELVEKLGTFALTDTSRRRSTFTTANLIASAERTLRGIRLSNAAERELLVDRIVLAAEAQAVQLSPQRFESLALSDQDLTLRGSAALDRRLERKFATQATLDDEAFLIERARTNAEILELDPEQIQTELEAFTTSEGHPLSADQLKAAHAVLTDSKALSAIIGPAGTGKTTTMRALKELWSQHAQIPNAVVGLAPSAVAASVLGQEIGAATENTTKWLYESVGEGAARRIERAEQLEERMLALQAKLPSANKQQRRNIEEMLTATSARLAQLHTDHERFQLKAGQLLIIDEASMVSTTQLAALARQADDVGAKVLLVGDPQQLDAVDAGGFLGWMDRHETPPQLDQVWRFKADWERQASLMLRDGDKDVLTIYEQHERIHISEDPADQAFTAWMSDTAEDVTASLLIAADNELVDNLNVRAQQELAEQGKVSFKDAVALRGQNVAGVGDVILARKNDRSITDDSGDFLKNGTRMKVESIESGVITARRLDTDATVRIDQNYAAASLELGYAITAHRAQGVTVDTAHFVATEGTPRELLYVAMTRGRANNAVYVADPEEKHSPDTWNIMKEQGPQSAAEVLSGILDSSVQDVTATETMDAEHGKINDFHRLVNEYEWVSSNSQTRRTLAWMQEHMPEERMNDLIQSADWARLATRTWPEQVPEDVDLAQAPVEKLLEISDAPPKTGHVGLILPEGDFLTDEHTRLGQDLAQRIERRLDYLTPAPTDEEKPEWAANALKAAPNLSEEEQRQLLRAITAWRAYSQQEEENPLPWGDPPDPKDRNMLAAWNSAHQQAPSIHQSIQLQPEEQETYAPPPPEVEDSEFDHWLEQTQPPEQIPAFTSQDVEDFYPVDEPPSWMDEDGADYSQAPPPADFPIDLPPEADPYMDF